MAPRLGSYSSNYHNDNNPWSEKVWLTLDNYPAKSLFLTEHAFDILSLIAFIIFLISTCGIRDRSLPLKGLICALIFSICSKINIIAWEALFVTGTEVTMYYLISLMLWDFFRVMAICIIFSVFWNLIHRFLSLITASGKPHVAVSIIHYILLTIIIALSLVEWGLRVDSYVREVTSPHDENMQMISRQVISASNLVCWVSSMEILAWMIFVVVKAGDHIFVSKVNSRPKTYSLYVDIPEHTLTGHFQAPAVAIITAATAWFAEFATSSIISIRYTLVDGNSDVWPEYLNTTKTILEFFFWIGVYTGSLLCCAKWHWLGDDLKYRLPQDQSQYTPAQLQPRYLAQLPEGQNPPVQQQPYSVAS
ncbi:hypothetical protein PITC_019070 [Penicillium italicum]|uniref:Uncharacterized protein n=1 Tax=Penicillium italicum TaxID=40296 RepID=A0A0A2KCQ4_PENIT|nr:hypothetical protein PITC_019070 [Penicillium italicum]